MESIDNPEWLVGQRLGFVLSTSFDVVHRTGPSFIMGVSPGCLTHYHGLLSSLWTKGEVTWWGKKPGLFAAPKLKSTAFEKFEQYFQIRNELGRGSPISINGYCTSCVGRIRALGGTGYGTEWFAGRPPEALTFYHDRPDIRDDWVIHLAEPVFTARVSGAEHVISATSVTGDKLQVTSDIEARVIQALRSYYYLFFASLDDLYARYNKPFALALYMDPTLDPAARDYQPDYEFDEAFTLAMDEWRTKDVFHINVAEAEVHRNGELLTAAANMLDFYLSDHALAALWHEGWFESASVPVKDFSVWPPFPRDNPHIILASTLLSAFLNGLAINSGNALALRLCVPLARELALTLQANQASITGKQLLRWINSKLTLPAGSPVDLFDEIVAETPCAIT